MGIPGRKPKPVELKVIEGNPGRRPLDANKPKSQVRLPRCPDQLQGIARREWYRVGRLLVGMRVLTDDDRTVLEMYCKAYQRWVDAEEQVKELGLVVDDGGKAVQNPYLTVATQTMKELRALMGELGLTPSSRGRISTQEQPVIDPFSAFLSKPKDKQAHG